MAGTIRDCITTTGAHINEGKIIYYAFTGAADISLVRIVNRGKAAGGKIGGFDYFTHN
jgi:hypothetical protein